MTRQAFEAFITAPPFEMGISRFDDRGAWPGSYKSYETDLVWQSWQAATAAALERAAEVCDGINADYTARYVAAGATMPNNLDFLDGASDGAEECAEAIRALKDES